MSRPTKYRPIALMAGTALVLVQVLSLPAHAEAQDPAESLRALFEKKTSTEPATKDAKPETKPSTDEPAAEKATNGGPLPISPGGTEKPVEPVTAPVTAPVPNPAEAHSDATAILPPSLPTAALPNSAPPALPTVAPTAAPIPQAAAPLPRVPAPNDETLQDISSLKGEISLLTLQVQRGKLLKELHQVEAPEKPANEQPATHQPVETTAPAQPAAQKASRIDLPSVIEISGSAGRLSATISSSDGGEVHARKGQRVPGGFRIRDIDTQGVLFERENGGEPTWYVGVGASSRQTHSDNGPQPAGMTPIPLQ